MDEVRYSETNKNENYVLHATVQGSHYFKKSHVCFMVLTNAHLLCQIPQGIQ